MLVDKSPKLSSCRNRSDEEMIVLPRYAINGLASNDMSLLNMMNVPVWQIEACHHASAPPASFCNSEACE